MASPSDIKPVFPTWPTRPVTDQASEKRKRKHLEDEAHKPDEKKLPVQEQDSVQDNDGHIDEYA
jgi:hypothetical protein